MLAEPAPITGIRWPETIQAIASVIALFIAIYIPIRIRNQERTSSEDERNLKAEKLAFFIYSDVFRIHIDTIGASSFLSVVHDKGRLPESISTEQRIISTLTIPSAQRLQATVDRLWLLQRDCGNEVNRAISFGQYINQTVASYFQTHDVSTESLKSFYSIYKSSFDDARESAEKATKLLRDHYKTIGL